MGKEDGDKGDKKEEREKEGDGTMSATATSYVYKAVVKGTEKKVPPISKEKLASFKVTVNKYMRKK